MKQRISSPHKTSQLFVISLFFFLASFHFLGCSVHRTKKLNNEMIKESSVFDFKKIKQSPDSGSEKWNIYSRKIRNSNFLEYKIEGNIKSSPKACVTVFRKDIYKQAKDPDNKKYPTYNIVYDSVNSLLTYVIHKEPFPLKNTEMSVRYTFIQECNDSNIQNVKWEEAWDEAMVPALSKKFNRVETFRGAWSFTSTAGNTCSAVNSVQFNPKKMPMWLVEPMVVQFLVKGLGDLRS